MRPHISLITLAVEDLERSVAFNPDLNPDLPPGPG